MRIREIFALAYYIEKKREWQIEHDSPAYVKNFIEIFHLEFLTNTVRIVPHFIEEQSSADPDSIEANSSR